MKKLLIYGAAGYTGSMAAECAASIVLTLVLAGRPRSLHALDELAKRLDAEVRIFSLDDSEGIENGLASMDVLLNAAGPFASTAQPLMRAAIRTGVHYLDFSAELDTYRQALDLNDAARASGAMLMPGSGGSVAMLGSLAGHALATVDKPQKISIALDVAGAMSKGSTSSARQSMLTRTLHLVDGELVERNPKEVRDFNFGNGPQSSFPVTLPDLLTIFHASGVANIETFVHVTAGALPTGDNHNGSAGPRIEELAANRYHAAVEVEDEEGGITRFVLDTVNGYTFTSMAAAEAARRVIAGEFRPGFQTPTGLFGHQFAETIADTRITGHLRCK